MPALRRYSPFDRALIELDHAARTIAGKAPGARRPYPARDTDEPCLTQGSRRLAVRLMRVNHAGEVSAQALYRGQAAFAHKRRQREHLMKAADEEQDHLAWCARRIDELGGERSRLDGFWYLGSFTIGALAGIGGDRYSLGFVAETERQVERHLNEHLSRLSADDVRSQKILEQMRTDEARHGQAATDAGGRKLPRAARWIMGRVSKVMTTVAFWV